MGAKFTYSLFYLILPDSADEADNSLSLYILMILTLLV